MQLKVLKIDEKDLDSYCQDWVLGSMAGQFILSLCDAVMIEDQIVGCEVLIPKDGNGYAVLLSEDITCLTANDFYIVN